MKDGNGRPQNELLHLVIIYCQTTSGGKLQCWCAMYGCSQSWSGEPQTGHIYKHIVGKCQHVDPDTLQKVSTAYGDKAIHAQLKASNSGDRLVEKLSKTEAKKLKDRKSNQAVLEFICALGLAPTIVNTNEWKTVVHSFDASADTYSSTKFADTCIPAKAICVIDEATVHLKKLNNLTISFDGGTTRATKSIYTIHITTPQSCQAYLIEGSERSGESHTGKQIADKLLKVNCFRFNLNLKSCLLCIVGHGPHWQEEILRNFIR